MGKNGSKLPKPAAYPSVKEAIQEAQPPGLLPLRNSRWEQFAHLRAAGLSLRESYLQAGYKSKPEHASSSASTLLKKPEIKERIQYLRQVLNASLVRRQAEVVRELEGIAFAKLTDFFNWPDSGKPEDLTLKSLDQIPPESLAALKSLQISPKGLRLTTNDKLDGLRQLATITGLTTPNQPKAGVTVVIVSPEKAQSATEWQEKYSLGREIRPQLAEG